MIDVLRLSTIVALCGICDYSVSLEIHTHCDVFSLHYIDCHELEKMYLLMSY